MYSNAGSENFGKFPVSGEIEYGMSYNYKQSTLEIHVKQCRGLAAVDQKRNSSDP
jgi:synaptotagmin-like protein